MTANNKGLFILLKWIEVKPGPPMISKKASEMTEEDKSDFFLIKHCAPFFSWTEIDSMTKGEQNRLIDFIIVNFIINQKKAHERAETEKEKIINFFDAYNKKYSQSYSGFQSHLKEIGKDEFINDIIKDINYANGQQIDHFAIQQYDFEGHLIKDWPKDNKLNASKELKEKFGAMPISISNHGERIIDSRDAFVDPLFMSSDKNDNIYVADYKGNKIVKFNTDGSLINLWRIYQENSPSELDSIFEGFFASSDSLYVVAEGYEKNLGFMPQISQFDLNGNLIKKANIIIPLITTSEQSRIIHGLIVDNKRYIYLFSPDTNIIILDNDWKEIQNFTTILSKGFDRPKSFYDPNRKRIVKFDKEMKTLTEVSFDEYSSDKLSYGEGTPGFYYANNIYMNPTEEIYVPFTGQKPFGVIDAMIFNRKGIMKGYWKHDRQSYSKWFDELDDYSRFTIADRELYLMFYKDYIFVARNLNYHNIIQKFSTN